jgi:hypothetical protein
MDYFAIPLKSHGGFLPHSEIKQVHSVQVKCGNKPSNIVIARAKDTPGLMCYSLHIREKETCTPVGTFIVSLETGQFQVTVTRTELDFSSYVINVAMETTMRATA